VSPRDHVLRRFVGVLRAPRVTLTAVAARPRALGMLLLVVLLTTVPIVAFLGTGVGQQAQVDLQVQMMESFGLPVSDGLYDAMLQRARFAPVITGVSFGVGLPVAMSAVAALVYGIFTVLLRGSATFGQVFAVVVHTFVVPAARRLLTIPINLARESLASPTNAAVLFPMLEEGSFLARLLGMIDLFIVWWVLVLAIGIAVLYGRPARRIAAALFGVYVAVAAVLAGLMVALGGR
jgi:hypothetical protein